MPLSKGAASRLVLAYETAGVLLLLGFLWLDEWLDLPHRLFGSDPTPFNWVESAIESVILLTLGAAMLIWTRRIIKRIRYLEGLVSVCSFCKRIRVEPDKWVPIEVYISERSDAEFSHGLCPECYKRYYSDLDAD